MLLIARVGRKTKVWAATFVLLSLGMFVGAVFVVPRWHTWKPLDMAFDLGPGAKVAGTFTSDLSTHFVLNLAVKPELEKTRLHCLMGMELPVEKCNDIRQAISIEWSVSEEGKEIARGDSTPRTSAYWSEVTARAIGYFKATENRSYTVTAISLSDGGELRRLSPRLIVETSPGDYEGFIYLSWLMMYAACVPLLLGVAIFAIGWILAAIKARRSEAGRGT